MTAQTATQDTSTNSVTEAANNSVLIDSEETLISPQQQAQLKYDVQSLIPSLNHFFAANFEYYSRYRHLQYAEVLQILFEANNVKRLEDIVIYLSIQASLGSNIEIAPSLYKKFFLVLLKSKQRTNLEALINLMPRSNKITYEDLKIGTELLMMALYCNHQSAVMALLAKAPVFWSKFLDEKCNIKKEISFINKQNQKVIIKMSPQMQAILLSEYELLSKARETQISEISQVMRVKFNSNGWETNLQQLIACGFNINVNFYSGKNALHLASERGDIEAIKLLAKYDADINLRTADGDTVMHVALKAHKSNRELINTLIELGAPIDEVDAHGNTALHLACKNQDLAAVDLLLNQSWELNALNKNKKTPLIVAIEAQSPSVVSSLLRKKVKVNELDGNGMAPLHYACQSGNVEIVELLLNGKGEQKSKINLLTNNGQTALEIAVENNKVEVVNLLLTKHAQYQPPAAAKDNILHCACRNGNLEIVKLLLQKFPELINLVGKSGKRALHIAVEKGNKDIVDALLKANANIKVFDFAYNSVLHTACAMGNLEVVKLIALNDSKNINYLNKNRETPLHVAAQNGHKEVVDYLVTSGANVEAIDKNNNTPIVAAVKNEKKETYNTLIDAGANVGRRNTFRQSAATILKPDERKVVLERTVENRIKVQSETIGTVLQTVTTAKAEVAAATNNEKFVQKFIDDITQNRENLKVEDFSNIFIVLQYHPNFEFLRVRPIIGKEAIYSWDYIGNTANHWRKLVYTLKCFAVDAAMKIANPFAKEEALISLAQSELMAAKTGFQGFKTSTFKTHLVSYVRGQSKEVKQRAINNLVSYKDRMMLKYSMLNAKPQAEQQQDEKDKYKYFKLRLGGLNGYQIVT